MNNVLVFAEANKNKLIGVGVGVGLLILFVVVMAILVIGYVMKRRVSLHPIQQMKRLWGQGATITTRLEDLAKMSSGGGDSGRDVVCWHEK